jgi:hypothetical protein
MGFRGSPVQIRPSRLGLVVVSWMMSHVIYGRPVILDVAIVDAQSVAKYRDDHYHNPPRYLTVEPQDTSGRTANLQQSNVNGYRLQESSADRLEAAQQMVTASPGRLHSAPSPEAQALANELMSGFTYRLDTNFAKIDRIDHPAIEELKSRVLARNERGQIVRNWISLLRDLDSDSPARRTRAEGILQEVYDEL